MFHTLTQEYKKDQPWWRAAKAYFDEFSLADHQISSYNKFIQEQCPEIICRTDIRYGQYIYNFDNVYIKTPEYTEVSGIVKKCFPQICRERNIDYTCNVYADLYKYTINKEGKIEDTQIIQELFLGSIPCMIGSLYDNLTDRDESSLIKNGECTKDHGGYFIIKGYEKVLISQDRMAHNEIFVFSGKPKHAIRLFVSAEKNNNLPCDYYAEVRSFTNRQEPNITTTTLKLSKEVLEKGEEARLYVEIQGFKSPINYPVLFMAFGVTTKSEMIKYVCDPSDVEMVKLLEKSLELESLRLKTPSDAIKHLESFVLATQHEQKARIVKKIISDKVFQNVETIELKRYYLGYMTNQLLSTALGRRPEDDRDHYAKKRVESAGSLINNLFKSIWKKIVREAVNAMTKQKKNNVQQLFFGKLTNALRGPFATGNWTATKTPAKTARVGISQSLNRHNNVATISNLRRVVTPSDKNGKIVKPRHLSNSQWFMLCPFETPEGKDTGLHRNLNMLCRLSLSSPEKPVKTWLKLNSDIVKFLKSVNINDLYTEKFTKVILNGRWIAISTKPINLVDKLKLLKRNGGLAFDVSICLEKEGIKICTDEGRLIQPFFVMENGRPKPVPAGDFRWHELVESGIVEYLDPAELQTMYHENQPWVENAKTTHCVIHPSLMMGIAASTAPFPNHNQSPRNIYQSSMCKQAVGVFAENAHLRYDSGTHTLWYPQKPIVNTQAMRLTNSDSFPSGANASVCVLAAGYNQEDSIIANKRSIDNGFLRSSYHYTYSEHTKRKGNTMDEIKKPDKTKVRETLLKGYAHLDPDGLSRENTPISKRDVLIGKVNTTNGRVSDTSVTINNDGMEDDSVVQYKDANGESVNVVGEGSAIIEKCLLTSNEDTSKSVKVKIRQMRIPQIGDKCASRSAQKGIIGMILQPEDMPFCTKTGITPDLIMNPNAFPSRMTMGQALETHLGKACALNGSYGDCSAFTAEYSREIVEEELERFGYQRYGDDVMVNGITGETMNCTLYMGPTYYQRLKHMVNDKIHSRNQDGPRETLTRQPVEGRKRSGGFRMGEMETWCGISHGASAFIVDRLINNSDAYEMYVCNNCNNTAIANTTSRTFECKFCQQNTAISKIRIPYAWKLIQQELNACGIGVWLEIDKEATMVEASRQTL